MFRMQAVDQPDFRCTARQTVWVSEFWKVTFVISQALLQSQTGYQGVATLNRSPYGESEMSARSAKTRLIKGRTSNSIILYDGVQRDTVVGLLQQSFRFVKSHFDSIHSNESDWNH
jgi:hypothetical protein